MAPSPSSSSAKHSARYYNGAGFGLNVNLHCHVDNNFTMSIVQVHMDRFYHEDDPIVCYFCFPRIGVAVALRPGDFLCLIRRNHIAYRLGANLMISFIPSPATLKPV